MAAKTHPETTRWLIRQFYEDGLHYREIAELLEVSHSSVAYWANEENRKRQAKNARKRKPWLGKCVDCGGPATKKRSKAYRDDRPLVCWECFNKRRCQSARETTLHCKYCDRWLPDEDFAADLRNISRRGRGYPCRECQKKYRRERYVARMVPCVRCGKMRTHPLDSGRGRANLNSPTGLCKECYQRELPRPGTVNIAHAMMLEEGKR